MWYNNLRGEKMKVFTIPLPPMMTNCYLAYEREGGKCFIIDPGANAEKIITLIELQQLKPSAILLTHGHFDHIEAADKLKKYFKIPIFIHKDDAEMVTDPSINGCVLLGRNDIFSKGADSLLEGGEEIKLEKEKLTVMHTPGHSRGSVCYVGRDIIFSGDTVFRGTYGRYDLYGGSFDDLMTSIMRIMTLDEGLTVYPGHDAKTTIADEKKYYKG